MINLDWVNDYIDISEYNSFELAKMITEAGINIENVIDNKIDNLVIGKVISCKNHPDSDHLHICKVDIKDEVLDIVCGANNVREGIKVVVAKVGAVLPGGFLIKSSTIRGVKSNGMICALFELGLEEKTEENYNKGIYEADDSYEIGEDLYKYIPSNTLYELDIHKHRNNDCLYHIGFAYEIGAIIKKNVLLPNILYKNKSDEKINIKLDVNTKKCSYYKTMRVKDVKIKESPKFIKERLNSVGIKSINNVVDISNYVMLEFGQPLHFYDADIIGNHLIVDEVGFDTKVRLLDEEEYILKKGDIVIKNDKDIIALAGIMGSLSSGINDNTKNIIIESAIFEPFSIRNTSNRLNLKSEASIRFSKGLNYEYTNLACQRCCYLLEKYADATIVDDYILHDEENHDEKKVEFTSGDIEKLLGIKINDNDIETELKRLDFKFEKIKDKYKCIIPKRRLDIDNNINDIAEEIGRLYGYNKLESSLPKIENRCGVYKNNLFIYKNISKRLRSLGLNEVKTYSLTKEENVKNYLYDEDEYINLPNPMSIDKKTLRVSLIPSLLEVYNYNNKRNINDILIYEISKVYPNKTKEKYKISGLLKGNYNINTWNNSNKIDFYLVKGIVEDLLKYLGFTNRYSFKRCNISFLHPGISAEIISDGKSIGIIGKIHPKIEKDDIYIFELDGDSLCKKSSKIKYIEAYKYPSIIKDMAFIMDKDMDCDGIIKTIKKNGTKILTDIEIFDVYNNLDNNKKSVAFKLIFNGLDKTLTDKEVLDIFNRIIRKVEDEHKIILRDK